MERYSPKVNVFCTVSRRRVFGPFFFAEDSVTKKVYLDMLENWLIPQLEDEEIQGYIYQQDGAPPHWHKEVREYLNERLPGRWVGRTAATDNTFCTPGHPGHQTWQRVISSCGVSSRTMFTSHHFQRHYQNCDSASTPQSGTSHKTCLRGFGGNGSIAWTSAVSHVGCTSNAFKVTIKLQKFLFQMVVT